jgi:hypothetical protein
VIRTAHCSCGQLTAVCEGDPIRVSICHCLACQARTGGPFGQQARWPAERVAIAGPARRWTRTGDEGSRSTFQFCPTCGATIAYENDRLPGAVMIPVGAFGEPSFPAPTFSVYEARMHRWVGLPGDIEHWD